MKDVPLVEVSANLNHICGRKGPETISWGYFMDAASPRKHLKFYNHHNYVAPKTFNLAED